MNDLIINGLKQVGVVVQTSPNRQNVTDRSKTCCNTLRAGLQVSLLLYLE